MSEADYTGDSSRAKHIQSLIGLPGGHAVRVRRAADGRAGRTVTTDPKTAAARELVSELDRAWLEHHPRRAHRVRRLVPGEPLAEPPVAPLTAYVVVKQIAPGLRVRAAFWGTRRPRECEACAADLWLKLSPPELQALAIEAAAIVLGRATAKGPETRR